MPLPEPASKQDQFVSDKERSKNEFVVFGYPIREIDIEVVGAVAG
jgi:hypothetical protein